MKKRREYRSKKKQLSEFDQVAETVTKRFGILCGIERISGYSDTNGVYWASAYTLHVDGLAFRVDSVSHAVAFLNGFSAGRDFDQAGHGRGCVDCGECERIAIQVVERMVKDGSLNR